MKKIILTIAMCFLVVGAAHADRRSILSVKSATGDTVFLAGTNDTVYPVSFSIKEVQNTNDIGILYKATSGGTVNLKIELEQSYGPPATEGSSDTEYLTTETIDASITDEVWHLATVDTVVLPYGRFKVTGQGSNDDGTTLQIKVSK